MSTPLSIEPDTVVVLSAIDKTVEHAVCPQIINDYLPTRLSSPEASDVSSDEDDMPPVEAENYSANPTEKSQDSPVDKTAGGEYRGRPSSCVFVASLAATLSDDELCAAVTDHFDQWGKLTMVKVLRDPANRPYSFVQYNNDADAKRALKEGQKSILHGRAIRCEPARVNRTLFVATADGKEATPEIITSLVEEFGEIEQLVAKSDSASKKAVRDNTWFVQFAYRDDAIRAYTNLKLKTKWEVEWAQNIEAPKQNNKSKYYKTPEEESQEQVSIDRHSIFVGQLDSSVTKELLKVRFEKHGSVSDVILITKPSNVFAFIKFETEKAAASAVERENHSIFLGKTMHVQYREIYHNRSKYNAPSKRFMPPRLNLAPPPVNMNRRSSANSPYGLATNEHMVHPVPVPYIAAYPFTPPQSTAGIKHKGDFKSSSEEEPPKTVTSGDSTINDAPESTVEADEAASTSASTYPEQPQKGHRHSVPGYFYPSEMYTSSVHHGPHLPIHHPIPPPPPPMNPYDQYYYPYQYMEYPPHAMIPPAAPYFMYYMPDKSYNYGPLPASHITYKENKEEEVGELNY